MPENNKPNRFVEWGHLCSRMLEETDVEDPKDGVWPITYQRLLCGWGDIRDLKLPVPLSCDPIRDYWEAAKPNRTLFYQRITSAFDCRVSLACRIRPSASFEITKEWSKSKDGIIGLPEKEDEPITGGHHVSFFGFNLFPLAGLGFQNSWGPNWGHGGLGHMRFEYFDRFLISGWITLGRWSEVQIAPAMHPELHRLKSPNVLARPEVGDGDTTFIYTIYNHQTDDRIGWAFVVQRGPFLDVEEFFVKPEHRQQGYGTRLLEAIKPLAHVSGRPLRFLVPFADCTERNTAAIEWLCESLHYSLYEPGVRWAAAMITAPIESLGYTSDRKLKEFPPSKLPPKPASPREVEPGRTPSYSPVEPVVRPLTPLEEEASEQHPPKVPKPD